MSQVALHSTKSIDPLSRYRKPVSSNSSIKEKANRSGVYQNAKSRTQQSLSSTLTLYSQNSVITEDFRRVLQRDSSRNPAKFCEPRNSKSASVKKLADSKNSKPLNLYSQNFSGGISKKTDQVDSSQQNRLQLAKNAKAQTARKNKSVGFAFSSVLHPRPVTAILAHGSFDALPDSDPVWTMKHLNNANRTLRFSEGKRLVKFNSEKLLKQNKTVPHINRSVSEKRSPEFSNFNPKPEVASRDLENTVRDYCPRPTLEEQRFQFVIPNRNVATENIGMPIEESILKRPQRVRSRSHVEVSPNVDKKQQLRSKTPASTANMSKFSVPTHPRADHVTSNKLKCSVLFMCTAQRCCECCDYWRRQARM